MVSDEAVITGTYADLKLIKTRKTAQMIIELPIEHVPLLIERFGMPDYGAEIPVAVARLDESVTARGGTNTEEVTTTPDSPAASSNDPPKPKSYAQRAGILSNDPLFWKFIEETTDGVWRISSHEYPPANTTDWAADYIRRECEVESRRDIIDGTEAGRRFRDLVATFNGWKMVA